MSKSKEQQLGDLFTKSEKGILDTIMPGGKKWVDWVNKNKGDCLHEKNLINKCPSYKKSTCNGPDNICGYESQHKINFTK